MKEPDKIVIQSGALIRTEKVFDNDIEYIRKDLLLEWVEERLRLYDTDYTSAGKELLRLIEKVKSL